MPKPVRISLDAMGGDHGPSVVIPGAGLALERHPDLRFMIFGNEAVIAPLLATNPRLRGAAEIHHTEIAIGMDEKPSVAIRAGRGKSSMWRAVQAVRDQEADACVSAGNTGALMAMAKICLKTMAHIERPAIAAMWPTLRESIVLDVGATIGADAGHLVDMAIMGAAMAGSSSTSIAPPSACSTSAPRRSRASKPSRRRAGFFARRTCRTSIIAASSRATTSGRAPSTWS